MFNKIIDVMMTIIKVMTMTMMTIDDNVNLPLVDPAANPSALLQLNLSLHISP